MKPLITFSKNTTSITLPAPQSGAQSKLHTSQVLGRTASGELYAYDQGAEHSELTLEIHSMTTAQKDALSSFFSNTALGMKETWVYEDAEGTEFTGRFLEPSIVFAQFAHEVWDCSLKISVSLLS